MEHPDDDPACGREHGEAVLLGSGHWWRSLSLRPNPQSPL